MLKQTTERVDLSDDRRLFRALLSVHEHRGHGPLDLFEDRSDSIDTRYANPVSEYDVDGGRSPMREDMHQSPFGNIGVNHASTICIPDGGGWSVRCELHLLITVRSVT